MLSSSNKGILIFCPLKPADDWDWSADRFDKKMDWESEVVEAVVVCLFVLRFFA